MLYSELAAIRLNVKCLTLPCFIVKLIQLKRASIRSDKGLLWGLVIQCEFVELFYVVLDSDALKPFCKETDLLLDKEPLSLFTLYSPPREQLLLFYRPLQLDIRILIGGLGGAHRHDKFRGAQWTWLISAHGPLCPYGLCAVAFVELSILQ